MPRLETVRLLPAALLLAGLALGGGDARAQSADAAAKRSLAKTERLLEQRRQQAEQAGEAARQAQAELETLRPRLVAAAKRMQDEETALADSTRRLAALAKEEARKSAALGRRDRELGVALASLSRLSRRSPTALLAGTGSPLDTYRGIRLVAATSEGLLDSVQELKGELAQLRALHQEIAAEQARHRARAAEMARQRTALAKLVAEKSDLEQRLADESRAAGAQAERMARQAADLRQLVAKLEEAERQRRREEAARAEAEHRAQLARLAEQARRRAERERVASLSLPPLPGHKPTPAVAAPAPAKAVPTAANVAPAPANVASAPANAATLARLQPPEPFSAARGKLPMPARGRIVEAFGHRDGGGRTSRGITIETLEQAQVVAPFDGEVVFAGAFRRYGLLLIISLGEGYHILLSGMGRLYGVVGQQVLAGEPVGEMGGVDAGQPRLYVELRRKGEPINPLPWLSAAKGKISG